MGVVTTRRLDQLQEECRSHGIEYEFSDSREMLMDRLRKKLGSFDATTEIAPMKAQETKSLIKLSADGPDYSGIRHLLTPEFVAEPKYDGVRMRVFIGLTGSTLNSGRRSVKTFCYSDRSGNFPHLAEICGDDLIGVILDGEILAPSHKIQTHTGTWTNSILNASVALANAKPAGAVATQERFGKAQFWAFDILSYEGKDIQQLPYHQRRTLLEMVYNTIMVRFPKCEMRIAPQLPATEETIRNCMADGYEGVVLKGINTPYLPDKRKGWWKVKTMSTADGFVVGWTPGKDRNAGMVGSLDLAVRVKLSVPGETIGPDEQIMHFPDGHWIIRTVAQVGNLTDWFRQEVTSKDDGRLCETAEGLVIEFVAQGVTKNGRVRHPHMIRIRPDKTPQDCGLDQLSAFPAV